MKWIRRRPSLYNHCRVAALCVFSLFASRTWVHVTYPGYHCRISDWIAPIISSYGRAFPASVFQDRDLDADLFYVARRDGGFIALHAPDEGYIALAQLPDTFEMSYFAGSYQTGLWAPTRWLDVQILCHSSQGSRTFSWDEVVPSKEQVFERQAALVSIKGLDPRLATAQRVADTRVIWFGYVVNTVCLLALIGLAWSLFWSVAWVPVVVRKRTRRRREAAGLCPKCAYNLEGTPDHCPECGWVPGEA